MKRSFWAMAAACLAIVGCVKEAPTPEPKDEISLSAESKDIPQEGGSASIIVTSSGEWKLEAKADYSAWITPSMTEGEDGDIVIFAVEANQTTEKLTSEWTFTCGTAKAELTINSLPIVIVPETVTIDSEKDVVLDYNKGQFTVLLTSSLAYRDVTVTLGKGAESWLKHVTTLEGETEGAAKAIFEYNALTGLDDLTETITFSGENVAEPAVVNVVQEAKHVMNVEKEFYTLAIEGETVDIPVEVNVEYSLTISAEGNGWLSAEKTATGIKVTAKAITDGKRSATITLEQTDAKEGEEPLKRVLSITQVNALIAWAADMTGNRLFPKWDGTAEKLGVAKALTLEAMINVDQFNANGISTLMGIEGMFLLRFGDSAPDNVLQIATLNGNYDVEYEFETNRWYHVACTYEMGDDWYATVKVYVDGELKGERSEWSMKTYVGWPFWQTFYGVNFSPDWSYEPTGTRCFWMGYSYDENRDLKGKMTEIRIWNKVLSAEEINAPDHFYTVDPKSEGLYSYWKFTTGQGSTIEDATGNGNKLYGETNVRKQGNDNKGEEGISWIEVSLPDR